MSRALLFNPIRAREGELEATLVARRPLLDELETSIVGDARGASPRHWLIVAPRGSGKSHLTEALARRIRAHEGWTVVRLPEEAYRVSSVSDLLAWVVGALEGVDRPFAAETDPARVEVLAESRLRRWRAERGPVLVILENLNQLLGRRFDRRGQARLRGILMGDPPFTLVATATRMFGEVSDHGAPFYDFFQERRLEDLTADEVAELVERRARWDDAREILEKPEELRPRLRALYHLSGGNPRLALALYGVLRSGLTREIYDQVLQLLDEVTPYYQARLNDASPQGARVLAEMAMAEGNLVPSEIGRRCGLKTTSVTAVLTQLQEERFVRPGGRPVDKRARYWEVTDRLFRVWLQMREQGDADGNLRWIVEFYRGWYGGDSTAARADAMRLPREAWRDGGRAWGDLRRTLRHLEEALGDDGPVVALSAWTGNYDSADTAHGAQLEAAWAGASAEERSAIAVPLALCRLKRGAVDEAFQALRVAAAAGDLSARTLLALGLTTRGRFDEARAVGAPAPYNHMVEVTAHCVAERWKEAQDLAASTPLTLDWYAREVSKRGRPDLLLWLRERPDASWCEQLAGPNWLLARFVAGDRLTDDEIPMLQEWLQGRGEEPGVVAAALRAAHQHWTSDADAARAEAAIPADQVFVHLMWRVLRRLRSTSRRWTFDPLQPFAIEPAAALAAWDGFPTHADGLRQLAAPSTLLTLYRELRAMNLLPEITPWADAERVATADDREAALSALHPEVREAVLLLLSEGARS